jgi:hypothetical protein
MKYYKRLFVEENGKVEIEEGSSWIPGMLENNNPLAYKKIKELYPKVAKELDFNEYEVFAFCVELLQDVNAHTEAKAVNNLLYRSMI